MSDLISSLLIQPLHKNHDKKAFRCGSSPLEHWLATIASQHQAKSPSRVYVATAADQPTEILGFYALAAGEILTETFPDALAKKRPNRVPIVRLGRVGDALSCQGNGVREHLLFDAVNAAKIAAKAIGINAIVVDAKNSDVAKFYAKYGFIPLTAQPLTLVLPMATLLQL